MAFRLAAGDVRGFALMKRRKSESDILRLLPFDLAGELADFRRIPEARFVVRFLRLEAGFRFGASEGDSADASCGWPW